MRQILTLIFSFSFSVLLFGAGDKYAHLKPLEDSLISCLNNIRAAKFDISRQRANDSFKELLRKTLDEDGVFDYPFDSLQISTIKSPDNSFRFFNWNVENDDYTHNYFCFIMLKQKRNIYEIIELIDKPSDNDKVENQILFNTNWFGALYYKIIPIKNNGKKAYTLLGWDGNDRFTNHKVIEVMTPTKGNRIKFGAPIFKDKRKVKKRVLFKYSNDVQMTLRYQKGKKRIVFDHLAPIYGRLDGQYEYYAPDFSYDSYFLKGNKWIFKEDVRPNSEPNKTDKLYNPPPPSKPNNKYNIKNNN